MTERNDEDRLDPIAEQLSAFADGELPLAESALLIARLQRDEPLRARWARYHAIGEALRGGLPLRYPHGLAAAVRAGIESEPVHAAGAGRAFGRIMLPLAGIAVAAGVALVGVLVVRSELSPTPSPVAPLTASAEREPALGAVQVDYSPAMQARLGAYVVRHGELNGRALPAVATHARVAARAPEEVPAASPASAAGTTPP